MNSVTMLRMSRRVLIAALCVWSSVLSAPATATVRVVTTIFPLADMVAQVGKQHVEVSALLPAGANPHTFEPSPAQIRALSGAAVFVCVGASLDAWAGKLLAARSGPLSVVTLTDGIELLGPNEGQHRDPHVWLDPILVRDHVVPAIVAALSRADPDERADFASGGDAFREALTRLDADIRALLATLTNRNYVAVHSAWRYFGRRYDLHEVATIEAFPGKEPSAQGLATVIQQARASGAHVLLIEPQFAARQAQQIAREIDARMVSVDPLGGPELPGRNHYVELMRYNAQTLAEAMR
jgi:ABC-type Zn uptake system ZnuABC Zn-binding protein ZnuA